MNTRPDHTTGNDHHPDQPAASKPRIAITMGDPTGIGAEVIAKALADPTVRSLGRFIIYGMEETLDVAAGLAELETCWYRCPHDRVRSINSGVVLADYDEYSVPPGMRSPSSEGGAASLRFVEDAMRAAGEGVVDAIVTGPIHKTSWKLAGCRLPGHTELLGQHFNRKQVTMMFAGGPLKVALASAHVGLFDLRNGFTIGRVFHTIDAFDEALRRYWGIREPRIAVAGLNPHAGEGGRFGDEESRIIEPAITMARELGILADGPFPGDTVFHKALHGPFDGVVAMYHDQGLIPVKLLAFDSAVNVTLGLPIIRTSVDHGTALDIAGRNKANPGSMKSAIKLACELASRPPFDCPRIPLKISEAAATPAPQPEHRPQ